MIRPRASATPSWMKMALAFQAAAGIGYAVMEDLTLTLGYRLIGTMEANFSKYDTTSRSAIA
jgi:opacity protein-like surface antigen